MQRKFQSLRKNKPIIGIVAFICTVFFILASTLAWFSATDARENNFKTNFKFKVELVDEFKKPDTFEADKEVSKKVSAVNSGDLDAFVRVMAFPVVVKVDGKTTSLPVNNGVEVSYRNLNITNWTDGNDGYYYYLGILKPGQEAPPLFDGVTFKLIDKMNVELKDAYKDSKFDIIVKTEAVGIQSKDYRLSWWGDKDNAPTNDPLKTIDTKLSSLLTP